jgi:hypothetical protein
MRVNHVSLAIAIVVFGIILGVVCNYAGDNLMPWVAVLVLLFAFCVGMFCMKN